MRRMVFAILAVLVLPGCITRTNSFTEYYEPEQTNPDLMILFQGEPVVLDSSGDVSQDLYRMWGQGYSPIGNSSFRGALAPNSEAIAQAKRVGANRIIIRREYIRTVSGTMPVTRPTTSTGYTSGTVWIDGRSGSYSGTTTIRGSETTYVPYSVAVHSQLAYYFAPMRRMGVGIVYGEPTEEVKRLAGNRDGQQIRVTRNDSPAFQADIRADDLIVAVNHRPIVSPDDLMNALVKYAGTTIIVDLYRGPMRLSKHLAAPLPGETW